MGNKRRRRQDDQFDRNLMNHIETLGIRSVVAYKQWCSEQGFSRRLKKSTSERRLERKIVTSKSCETNWRPVKSERLPHADRVEQIIAGKIRLDDVSDKQDQRLCDAVERLELLDATERESARNAFRELYHACEQKHARFVSNGRPSATDSGSGSCSFLEALVSVACYSNDWIRPIGTWKIRSHNQRRQFESLVCHLFAKYEMPQFFYSVWYQRYFLPGLNDQKAFVHVAAGHSIRQIKLPIPFSKRMSHHFMRAPTDCSFRQAVRWGQVLGMGGDPPLARALLATFQTDEFRNSPFWTTVIQWFIDNPMMDRELFGVVADYLQNQKFDGDTRRIEVDRAGHRRVIDAAPTQPNLSMKGRTPAALMREVERWHRDLQLVGSGRNCIRWKHSGIREYRHVQGEQKIECDQSVWTIRQILGSDALCYEGRKLNHCVASYAQSCFSGITSIWTMRLHHDDKAEHKLTVEVRLANRTICQARGKNNRSPTEKEFAILHRWAQVADLTVANYL